MNTQSRKWLMSSTTFFGYHINHLLRSVPLVLLVFSFLIPKTAVASNLSCDNRYLTLVNPVRSRSLWSDQSLKPILDQYQVVSSHNFPATWLLQYATLSDKELLQTIKNFDSKQEKGIFLEVSADLAKDARVIYPQQTPWFKPNAVFLSGYTQSDRKKLIDTSFKKFRQQFGQYPKSVGAWWIDSYSLQYMQQKYGLASAMIVADQLSTDNYRVWGQWWSVPYFPSKANILESASSLQNKLPVTIIQWAQRDPLRAYGNDKQYSNFSIQANDYSFQGLNTDYFKEITSVYLNCANPVGQITVGLETGQESVPFIGEYNKQLDYLQSVGNLKAVTMSDFAKNYSQVFQDFPHSNTVQYQSSNWKMTISGRDNDYLGDRIKYNQNLAFADYFVPDNQGFLDRKLPLQNNETRYFPWWAIFAAGGIFLAYRKKKIWVGITGFLFAFSSYGLIFKSFYQFGWQVYFGAFVNYLPIAQIGLVLLGFGVMFGIFRVLGRLGKLGKNEITEGLFWPVVVFGLDPIFENLRYTKINGETFLGILTDPFHLIGVGFGRNFQFVNQDFSLQIAAAFLKLDFQKIWLNTWAWLLIYPLIHLILGLVIFLLLRKCPKKLRLAFLMIFGILWLIFIIGLLSKDPRFVRPN